MFAGVLGLVTVLTMISAEPSPIAAAWLRLLRLGFGWGAYLLPLALLLGGLWLLLRRGLSRLSERLPRVQLEQFLGVASLYLALLVLLHIPFGLGDLAAGRQAASAGLGGGWIGAGLLGLMVQAMGAAGAIVVWVAWLLLGVAFAAGLSIPELLAFFARMSRAVGGRFRSSRRPRPLAFPSMLPPPTQVSRGSSPDPTALAGLQRPASPATAPALASASETPTPSAWALPDLSSILEPGAVSRADDELDRQRARLIEETLVSFGAPARVVEIHRGPTITQFGVEPDFVEGRGGKRTKVKVSKISALADDLALALAAPSIRIEAPVPGKGFVGVEVPNTEISLVALRDVMEADSFHKVRSTLRLALGQDVSGHAVAGDLTAMPHLLIAGTTGSGKSVCVNAIVTCLLLQNTPEELKLLMIDPKRVELTFYNGVPHLLAPVVVDLERVVPSLQWVSREMDERYRRLAREGARNIADYNQRALAANQRPLPFLVVVIDELADLMMLAPDETERVLTRLAQLARATGIHLVVATQRPSVDVVTGLIKANFPSRIAFAVASSVDSRVILDQPGAERLLGRGDMLYQGPDAAAPVRMQGAFVSEGELERLIRFWKDAASGAPSPAGRPFSAETIPVGAKLKQAPLWQEIGVPDDERDELFQEAVQVVRQMQKASISLLQRRLRIGYTRAARLIDQLEEAAMIGPAQPGSQARAVLDPGDAQTESDPITNHLPSERDS